MQHNHIKVFYHAILLWYSCGAASYSIVNSSWESSRNLQIIQQSKRMLRKVNILSVETRIWIWDVVISGSMQLAIATKHGGWNWKAPHKQMGGGRALGASLLPPSPNILGLTGLMKYLGGYYTNHWCLQLTHTCTLLSSPPPTGLSNKTVL